MMVNLGATLVMQTSNSWTPLKKGKFCVLNQPQLMRFE